MTRQIFVCPECGPEVAADEDGCCATCGRDCSVEPARGEESEVMRLRRELTTAQAELGAAKAFHDVAVAERNLAHRQLANLTARFTLVDAEASRLRSLLDRRDATLRYVASFADAGKCDYCHGESHYPACPFVRARTELATEEKPRE